MQTVNVASLLTRGKSVCLCLVIVSGFTQGSWFGHIDSHVPIMSFALPGVQDSLSSIPVTKQSLNLLWLSRIQVYKRHVTSSIIEDSSWKKINAIHSSSLARQPYVDPGLPQKLLPAEVSGYCFFRFRDKSLSRVGLSASRPSPGYSEGPIFSVRIVSFSRLVSILKRQDLAFCPCMT
jgi:hypothetical protein